MAASLRCEPFRPLVRSARRAHVVACKASVTPVRSEEATINRAVALAAASFLSAVTLLSSAPAQAEFRLPPISSDPDRCQRGFVGNTIGQANAVSDKILDIRGCSYAGKDLSGKTLSGALMVDTDMSNTNLSEAVLTKAYAQKAILAGANLTNAVVDRVDFSNANLKGAKLINAVVTGTLFEGADLSDTVWEDALIGNEDVKRLCSNPTLTGESRLQVGCRGK